MGCVVVVGRCRGRGRGCLGFARRHQTAAANKENLLAKVSNIGPRARRVSLPLSLLRIKKSKGQRQGLPASKHRSWCPAHKNQRSCQLSTQSIQTQITSIDPSLYASSTDGSSTITGRPPPAADRDSRSRKQFSNPFFNPPNDHGPAGRRHEAEHRPS